MSIASTKERLNERIKNLVKDRDKWEHEAIERGREMVKIRRLILNHEHMLDPEFFSQMTDVVEDFWERNGTD